MTAADVTFQDYRLVNPDQVTPHPDNPRRGHLAAITESIRTNGFYGAIVVQASTSRVIAGNHRLLAARELGLERIPATFVDVDDQTALRILAVDNRANDLAGYDNDALLELLTTLDATEMRLEGTGYTDADLDQLLNPQPPPALTDADEVPEAPAVPVTQPGDVWLLGPHRLLCGDATDPAAWDALLGDERIDLVWTDPPYGLDYVGGNHTMRPEERRAAGGLEILNDHLTDVALTDLLRAAFTAALIRCRPGAGWYVTAPVNQPMLSFAIVLAELGIWHQTLAWVKDSLVFGRSDYHYRHEDILYGWAPGAAHHEPSDRTQDTVWEIPRPRASEQHPTMKPVELITRAIDNSTDPGAVVTDPFAGSGSTLIACNATGRVARLMEIDPAYCDVILQRFTDHTGITPTNQDTGQQWAGKRHTSETAAV